MLRRLTRLELHGYKTFASKTDIEFGDVTCIVGPNGSGKSNIADGVRWVLGEQSYSLLRGRKTEDMIFSGSEQRSRASMASATIVFDNSDGWLPIDFSEVSLTRRAYRDGQNEYLLNGQKTRLRDVADLLGKVGLAQRTYTVIGQGLVDTALSLKADERRKLFEEAAGIGVYRHKREDALRKLEQTRRNLERVSDILAEIRPRLRALERQARRAQEFHQLQEDLRHLLRSWYGYHWHTAQQDLSQAQERLKKRETQLSELWEQQQTRSEQAATRREKVSAKRKQLSSWHQDAAKLHEDYESLHREIAVTEERARNMEQQCERIESELISMEANLEDQQARVQQASEQHATLKSEHTQALQRQVSVQEEHKKLENKRAALKAEDRQQSLHINELGEQLITSRARNQALDVTSKQLNQEIEELEIETQKSEHDLQEATQRLHLCEEKLIDDSRARERVEEKLHARNMERENTRTELEGLMEKVAVAQAEVERLQVRQRWISQQSTGEENTVSGQQRLFEAASAGHLQGHIGKLMDLIETAPHHETAIGAVLGNSIQASVVSDWPAIDEALMLLEQHGGRATLLPLAQLRPPPVLPAPNNSHFIGWAVDLVQCAREHRPAIAVFLGQTAICDDRAAARKIASELPPGAISVTLTGEIYRADGSTIIGSTSQQHGLAMAREARTLPEKIEDAQSAHTQLEQKLNVKSTELEGLQTLLQKIQTEHAAIQKKEQGTTETRDAALLDAERSKNNDAWYQQQLENLHARLQTVANEQENCMQELDSLTTKHSEASRSADEIQAKLLELDADVLNETVTASQTELAVVERALHDANTRKSEVHGSYEGELTRVNARRAQAKTFMTQIRELRDKASGLGNNQKESQKKLNQIQAKIDPEEATIHSLEIELFTLDGPEEQFREKVHSGEHKHAQAQVGFQRAQDKMHTLESQINDDFGLAELKFEDNVTGSTPLPFDQLVEHLEYVSELPEGIEESINRRRVQLRRLGGINPEALQEYEDVKQRDEHLTTQIKDLEVASSQLREVISELDELMQREFQNTFDAVSKEFEHTFERLFGGGSAHLELNDPGDLSKTGVEIIARLPGRRQQGLALLSGGERALVACALIFALLRVSPTPFALLDEVDAMLDESNVGRFRAILSDISENTQFVLITHNRHTVEVADTVYGINMGMDSSSTVISLKPDEIE